MILILLLYEAATKYLVSRNGFCNGNYWLVLCRSVRTYNKFFFKLLLLVLNIEMRNRVPAAAPRLECASIPAYTAFPKN